MPSEEREHEPDGFVPDETSVGRFRRESRHIARYEHEKRHVKGIDKAEHEVVTEPIVIRLLNRVPNYDEKNREAFERVSTRISLLDSRLEAMPDCATHSKHARASGCQLFSDRHRSRV